MKSTNVKNSLILLLTATIWGIAFVAQSVGMDHVGPFTFLAVRSYIGAIVLLPCIWLLNKINPKKEENISVEEKKASRKTLIIGGICCGVCLMSASAFQQMGIQYTTVGRAGFITACYIILVPIISWIFLKKKCNPIIWVAVALSLIGLYLGLRKLQSDIRYSKLRHLLLHLKDVL